MFGQIGRFFDTSEKRIGLQIGFGNAFLLQRTYTYDVNFYQFQYFQSLLRSKNFDIDWLVQPQVNTTNFRLLDSTSKLVSSSPKLVDGVEFGATLGIVLRANILKDFIGFYASGAIGPHIISSAPVRQVNGFLFSDNVFAGLNVKVLKNFYLDFRVGLRHLSNGGLNSPNFGLNNFVYGFGFYTHLKNEGGEL